MNKEDLKFGDIVEVEVSSANELWENRIFVKFGSDSSIICVEFDDEKQYHNGNTFTVVLWHRNYWRIKRKYIPFTWDDRNLLLKHTIKHKSSFIEQIIYKINGSPEGPFEVNNDALLNELTLLKSWTFLDGTPVGKLDE